MAFMLGGTFRGGAGDDDVSDFHDGTFIGGSGDDTIAGDMPAGRFSGGPGRDEVLTSGSHALAII